MAFNLGNFKEKVVTTVPYVAGECYEATVIDVSVVKTDYLRITFKVEDHENVSMFGTLYPTVSKEDGKRICLGQKITAGMIKEYLNLLSKEENNNETN